MRGGSAESGNRGSFAFAGSDRRVLLKGLYKFAFKTARGTGCGVMFATETGRLFGGNSGSSFIGTYTEGDEIVSEMMMSRHNHDPQYAPLYPVDNVHMTFRRLEGRGAAFRRRHGGAARRLFESILTPISDADAPPAGTRRADGIRNGLYSIHIRMLDGVDGGNTGVMMLNEGRIRGGDAYFDYIGAYTGRRPLEGRDRQPRAHAEQGRTAAVRRPRGRHRLFRQL